MIKKSWWLLIGAAAIVTSIAVGLYLYHKKRILHYTTPQGSWLLKWEQPTGTPPISYSIVIMDAAKNTMINTSTTNTSILLDPSVFVPAQGKVMSDSEYTAAITPTNAAGSGSTDVFNFNIYDTPIVISIVNAVNSKNIYPSNDTDIFDPRTNNTPADIILTLKDKIDLNTGLQDLSLINNGIRLPPPYSVNSYPLNQPGQELYAFFIKWCETPNMCNIKFNPGDKVTLSIKTSNPAGTYQMSNIYTAPPPLPTPPGNISNGEAYYQPN